MKIVEAIVVSGCVTPATPLHEITGVLRWTCNGTHYDGAESEQELAAASGGSTGEPAAADQPSEPAP